MSRRAISSLRVILAVVLAVTALALLVWLGRGLGTSGATAAAEPAVSLPGPAIRIGLVPERDIFAQRKRHLVLADYLGTRLGHPVQIVTEPAYQDILADIQKGSIDGAFVGSFTTVLAADRCNVRLIARAVLPGDVSSYHGAIIVPKSSSITATDQLRGKSVAMVRTTMAGQLFPMSLFKQLGLIGGSNGVKPRWVGTHDDVILEVLEGRADAGAVKDSRLDEFERIGGHAKFRRLATSPAVPENALVARGDLDPSLLTRLSDLLLQMKDDPQGKLTLEQFGAVRFEPAKLEEYHAIYGMLDVIGDDWPKLGIAGDRPRQR